MVKVAKSTINAVNSFERLDDIILVKERVDSTHLQTFIPRINGRDFDVLSIQEKLMEVVNDFALTRLKVNKYVNNQEFARLSKEARQTFRAYSSNTGELGELFLYTFLEGQMRAPQILSKMSLKTTPGDYTKKSDGIHYYKLPESDKYHLIFGEAKMYTRLIEGFKKAFESIAEHQSGKEFEKSLISSQIENEFIEPEDKNLIYSLLYPTESVVKLKVSDAFGIFIGFEIKNYDGPGISEDGYEKWLKNTIMEYIQSKIGTIEKQITDNNLIGNNFYVYLMPFFDLKQTRTNLTKGITE